MGRRLEGSMNGRKDDGMTEGRQKDGWRNARMDSWMDRQMDGHRNGLIPSAPNPEFCP